MTNLGFTAFKSYAAGQGATTIQQYTTPPALVGVNYQSFNASALANSSIAVKVANGTTVNVAFGTGSGQISSLTQLNAALAPRQRHGKPRQLDRPAQDHNHERVGC
ncbi:hypothetical protein [Methylobacterium currus]|uniref:hypothetical protein n=1 Tax=Methylobacterium currus TaxID=2051553 RepID=UPI000F4D6963|nr:hypothetical protein [Methylobacterium currus]